MDTESLAVPRRPRRTAVALLAAAVAVGGSVTALALTAGGGDGSHGGGGLGHSTPPPGVPGGLPIGPADVRLVSYRSCDALLHDLRTATAKHVTAWGLPGITPDGIAGRVGPRAGGRAGGGPERGRRVGLVRRRVGGLRRLVRHEQPGDQRRRTGRGQDRRRPGRHR